VPVAEAPVVFAATGTMVAVCTVAAIQVSTLACDAEPEPSRFLRDRCVCLAETVEAFSCRFSANHVTTCI
jgi:hypothetical protein